MTQRTAALLLALSAAACSSGPSGPSVARVVIDGNAAVTILVDDTRQLSARAEDAAGTVVTGAPIVWSTTASTVATVSTAGLVTALAPGTARIIATSGSVADTVLLTVQPSTVVNVVVTIRKTLLKVSDTVTAVATPVNALGEPVPGREVTWSSSNGTAAVVTPFGLVLGVAPANPVTISATVDGRTGSTTIAIIPAEIAEVVVSPDTVILAPAGSVQLQVSVIDEFGFDATDRTVTWSSFLPDIATVDQTGRVTALALGESTIRATVDGVTGESLIRVLAVETEKYRIEVTNFLVYPVEILENGNSIGSVGAQSSGTFERPLRATSQVTWALRRPQVPGVGEMISETFPTVQDPVGTLRYEVDNVLDDGRAYFTPYLRNLWTDKILVDPLPKLEAVPCICSASPEVDISRDLGYWLLNPTTVVRFFRSNDQALTDPRLVVPVPAAEVEARSGIWRHVITTLP